MEHVDVTCNPETIDALSVAGRQQQRQRDLSEFERQHHISLISPASELYVGVGQLPGATVNSADDSFRNTANGSIYAFICQKF